MDIGIVVSMLESESVSNDKKLQLINEEIERRNREIQLLAEWKDYTYREIAKNQ